MRKLFDTITLLCHMFADFLYAPLIRAHLREIAMKAPYFPGQIWYLPRLGRVRIKGVTDFHVNYSLMDDESNDDVYTVSRKDFLSFSRDAEDSNNEPKGTVIPFNFNRKHE